MMAGASDAAATASTDVVFNFDRNSNKYIRKVLNTNPILTNTTITTKTTENYWVGETFEREVYTKCTGTVQFAAILPMAQNGTAVNQWQEHFYSMRRSGESGTKII